MEHTNILCRLLSLSHFLSCILFFMNSIGSVTAATASTTSGFTNETDKQALLALKDIISGDPSGVLSSWNNSLHVCRWHGVACSRRHQRVTLLDLSSLELMGSVPPHIGNLTFLRSINLENNRFHGTLPQEVGQLFRLQYLLLRNNSFQGELPTNLSHCSNIRVIDADVNNLAGNIPSELGSLSNLLQLRLSRNNFTGTIPPSLGNISSIRALSINDNNLEGNIPFELGQLLKLESLELTSNILSGTVPLPLYNISSISYFALTLNELHGNLPPDLGLTLPNIQTFYCGGNKFSGPFPPSITNASELVNFEIAVNNFTGLVPTNLGILHNLELLNIAGNQFGSNKTNDLSFIDSLINCTNLQQLWLAANRFGGVLPDSIANLSTKLTILRLDRNYISGGIPEEIVKLINLQDLSLHMNSLTGSIPESIGKLHQLQGLYVYINKISGKIPSSIGNITRLSQLAMARNMVEGSIPIALANCTNLQALDLQSNHLTGVIPEEIIGLYSLTLALYLNENHFTGSLSSQVGNLKNLGQLIIAENQLIGEIPSTLGNCLVLELLHLQGNHFEGAIPSSFQQLRSIQLLDLSRNNLSGQIPGFLGDLPFIQNLNLSHNKFEGEVPTEGVFKNISAFSIVGNMKLCGGIQALQLPACPIKVSADKAKKPFPRRMIPLVVILPISLFACLFTIFYFFQRSKQQTSSALPLLKQHPKLSYAELFQATSGFSIANFISDGRYGSVYKGILNSGEQIVAVKVLKLQQHGANKSFLVECETLRNLRHRNLIKIITSCSSVDFKGNDFKALVFDFMPNGSLDSWLHPSSTEQQETKNLDLLQRVNIAIDVASALDYQYQRGTTLTRNLRQ